MALDLQLMQHQFLPVELRITAIVNGVSAPTVCFWHPQAKKVITSRRLRRQGQGW